MIVFDYGLGHGIVALQNVLKTYLTSSVNSFNDMLNKCWKDVAKTKI